MGVWIETLVQSGWRMLSVVTPFVGVWIETGGLSYDERRTKSHPSWVCGLKQELARPSHSEPRVTPFVGVWIETVQAEYGGIGSDGHTLRGCVD